MYIQITTRCNMQCDHCCYSCTAKGEDMSRDTFFTACKLAEEYSEYIGIGGGEPTIHPLFWDFLGLGLAHTEEGYLWMATNGKITETALILAKLAKKGVIAVELSQDEYHERISEKVIEAFTVDRRRGEYISNNRSNDLRGIRDVTQQGSKNPVPVGRAKELFEDEEPTACVCNDLFVAPNGDIYSCGCQTIKLGTVYQPDEKTMDRIKEESFDNGWCQTYT